jgi:sensor domain CHASE-containing protein
MLFIEPRIPSRELSVTLMIIAALVTAVAWFCRGVLRSRRERLMAQAQIEAAEARYEDEIG